jgi:glycosyltransferase involved in cell wall biosynthesis
MDVFVMYSRTEGTPRAMMEAMAVGLPVVSTDAGLCGDVFTDGEDGFLLGGDPDKEIVDCLQRFVADRGLGRRMGLSGRARALRDYDAAKLFPAYRSLIVETANS